MGAVIYGSICKHQGCFLCLRTVYWEPTFQRRLNCRWIYRRARCISFRISFVFVFFKDFQIVLIICCRRLGFFVWFKACHFFVLHLFKFFGNVILDYFFWCPVAVSGITSAIFVSMAYFTVTGDVLPENNIRRLQLAGHYWYWSPNPTERGSTHEENSQL